MRSQFIPARFASSVAPLPRRRALRTSGVVMLALAATLAGCSSDDIPGAASPSSPLPALATADADMSAVGGPTVLIGPSGRQVRLAIKPIADFVAKPGTAPPYAPRSFQSAGPLEREEPKPWPGASADEPIPASAWVLAYAAAASCGVGGGVTEEGVGPNPHLTAPPILPTWKQGPNGTRAFGMFPAPPATCEEALAQSEALVCTAARLSALASSPGVTLLKSIEPVAVRDGLPPGPWAFPPMAEDQRALARELALHLLANVAVTDMVRPGGGTDGATCSERWGKAASDPDAMLVQADTLFGTLEGREPAFYPPRLPVSAQSVRRIAATRLQIEAHVLRLASRLTAELQRASVESAVDAGRARAARTGSADAAARILWGMDGTGRYERASMAGAFRASAGRLDLGSGAPDRACAGTPGSRLLADRFGADLDAHVLTPAPSSAGERDAVALIEGLGLVLPDAVVEQLGDDELRSMVAEQAAWSLARADGDAPVDVDAKRDLSQRRVAGLATGDLRFALRRSWGLYRAVTGAGRDAVAVAPHALLPADALDTAPAVASQGGGVVPGLSQDRLPRGGTARLATMAAAAACPQDPLVATDAGQSFDEAFQGAAPLRGVLYRRLLRLRESARKAGFDDTTSLGRALSTMSGEARAVAGGRVAIQRTGSRLSVRLSGFDPAMLPGSTPEAIADNLVVVRGSPLIAECAAGLRHDCPPGVVAAATAHAQDVVVDQVALSDAAEVTAEGRGLTATYVLPPGTESETTYVIAGTTETTGGEGAVLGAMVPVGPDGEPPTGGGGSDGEGGVLVFTTTQDPPNPGGGPISGLTDDGPRRPSDLGDYCTTGLTKMTYVPVSNELTGSVGEPTEPSFRQWIELAKKASARADELGHRALDQQAQAEMRREGATEELRRLCGDVGSLSDVKFVNGKIVTSNASLADCMGLPGSAVDVAWLTTDPVKGAGDAPLVGGVLGCDVDGNKPLCKKLAQGVCPGSGASCQGVSHAGLGLASYTTVSAPDGDCRANVLQAMQGYATGSSLGALTKLPWAGPDGLDNAIGYLSVREVPGGAWEVLHGSTPVMSTDLASGKFPACAQPGAKACDSDAYYFSALFRSASTKPVPCEPGYVEAGSPAVGCVAQLGGAADGLDASEELRALLWRVEGAIWLLGAMGSGVPSGAFEVAVPVVDYGDGWPDGDKPAPAVTYFGATGMVSTAASALDTPVYQPKGLAQIDAATLSPLYAKPAGSWPSSLLGQMPAHFGVVYGTQGRYVQTYPSYVGAPRAAPLTLENIQALAGAMSGGSCATLYGAGGPAGGVAAINQVLDYPETRFVCSMEGRVPVSQPGLFAEVNPDYPAMLFRGPLVPTPSRQAWSGTNEDDGPAWSAWGGFGIFPQKSATSVDWPCQPTKDPSTGLWLIHSTCVAQDLEAEYTCDKDNGYPAGQSIDPFSDKCAGLGTAAYRPTSCSPSERAGYWINRFGPKTGCEARAMAYQALGMACQAGSSASVGAKPPAVTKIEHLALVEAWTKVEAARFRRKLGALHLEYVPRRVVDDFAGGKIGSGPLGGARGEQILAYERALQEITTGWISIEQGLLGVADALKATNLQLQSLQIQATKENANLALQSIGLEMQRVQAVLAATNTIAQVGLTSPGAVAASGIALAQVGVVEHYAALAKTQSAIVAQAIVENKANQTAVALLQLHQTTNGHYEKIQQSLSAVRSATAGGLAAGNRLRELAVQARVEAAKATTGIGSAGPADAVGNPPVDYVLADTNGDGTEEPVPLAVNSVLRRTYDLDQLRYLRQEKEAKRLACLARMSVEQRIGRRLSSLQSPVGDEIPASWADEVAFATGFHPLMGKELALPITDPAALPGLQNLCPGAKSLDDANLCKDAWSAVLGSVQFVGDYVQRLEDFVGLYTAKAPFKEADDVTILSLAKDVLAENAPCRTPSRNLLRSSGRLATSAPSAALPGFVGWRSSKCSSGQASCLVASEVLSQPTPPPPLVPIAPPSLPLGNGISWLLETPAPGGAGGSGSGGPGGAGAGGTTGGAGGAAGGSAGTGAAAGTVVDAAASSEGQIYQIVRLSPGAHMLSWWAASLEPNGTPSASARTKYVARVLGPAGGVLSSRVETADPLGAAWPARELLGIQVQQEGLYAIVFGGLEGLDGLPGSLAISDVQLEVDPSGYGATPYEATGLNGLVLKGSNCAANGKDLRSAFSYECTPNPVLPEQPGPDLCRWVLRQPFSLLEGFSGGTEDAPSRLRGRFARGNDNYRHVSIAVNLVGTNVHSCPGGSSPCYASGYEQFGLLHDASAVRVLTGSPGAETFNFARGFIHDGRAIATEKYLTLPLSGSDAGMLSQPNFERPELRGRPLDGQYHFSIVDSPTFRFENLEDVQFVLHYHYWSAVDGGGGPPAPGGYGAPPSGGTGGGSGLDASGGKP